jgi:hypothetical protein
LPVTARRYRTTKSAVQYFRDTTHLSVAEMPVPVLKKKLRREIPVLLVDAQLTTRDEDDVAFQNRQA